MDASCHARSLAAVPGTFVYVPSIRRSICMFAYGVIGVDKWWLTLSADRRSSDSARAPTGGNADSFSLESDGDPEAPGESRVSRPGTHGGLRTSTYKLPGQVHGGYRCGVDTLREHGRNEYKTRPKQTTTKEAVSLPLIRLFPPGPGGILQPLPSPPSNPNEASHAARTI